MVEFGVSGGNGDDNSQLQSSSVDKSQLPLMDVVPPSYHAYPPPLTTYVEIVGSSTVFLDTLKKLHAAMGTKFMIPVVGGRELDLYKLFVEVTSRGGIFKVMKDKRWKEVTAAFSFPSSATNASFIIRKYYVSLLYHYEQIYLFKAKYWTPLPSDSLPNASTLPPLPQVVTENVLPMSQVAPQQQATVEATEVAASSSASAQAGVGSQVYGVIDGKFESGYLITVKIGTKDFRGVLYQASPANAEYISPNQQMEPQMHTLTKLGLPRRKRRKKCEIRKRDPAHPKPNRSGYNFFFAEQHARLKPLYSGRDREISRMIGELWNKLQEPERAVYQEKAQIDKERYKTEMEDYRERLKTGQIINKPIPIQQSPIVQDLNLADFDVNLEFEGTTSAYVEENDSSDMEGNNIADKDSEVGQYPQHDTELENVNIEMLGNEAFQLQTGLEKNISSRGDAEDGISAHRVLEKNISSRGIAGDGILAQTGLEKNISSQGYAEDGISAPVEEGLVKSSNDDEQVNNH